MKPVSWHLHLLTTRTLATFFGLLVVCSAAGASPIRNNDLREGGETRESQSAMESQARSFVAGEVRGRVSRATASLAAQLGAIKTLAIIGYAAGACYGLPLEQFGMTTRMHCFGENLSVSTDFSRLNIDFSFMVSADRNYRASAARLLPGSDITAQIDLCRPDLQVTPGWSGATVRLSKPLTADVTAAIESSYEERFGLYYVARW